MASGLGPGAWSGPSLCPGPLWAGWQQAGGRGSATCWCSDRNWREPSTPAKPSPKGCHQPWGWGWAFTMAPSPKNITLGKKLHFAQAEPGERGRGLARLPRACSEQRSSPNPRQNPLPGAQGRLQAGPGPGPEPPLWAEPRAGSQRGPEQRQKPALPGAPGRPPTAACPLSPAAYIQPRSDLPWGPGCKP